MKFQRINHIGIIVSDLPAAIAFFVQFGFEVQGQMELEGEWLSPLIGLQGLVKDAFAFVTAPDGGASLELIKFYTPTDDRVTALPYANTLGIRHIAIEVDDIEAIVAKLKQQGNTIISEPQDAGGGYKLSFVRGPDGIIVELAEKTP